MDAIGLDLPQGVMHAQIIDGMREIAMYSDIPPRFAARWTTVIGGNQFHHDEYWPAFAGQDLKKLVESHRSIVKAKFQAIEENLGLTSQDSIHEVGGVDWASNSV